MLKKATAIILIMILALSISSPAYAALPDESQTAPRSVEEILNDHHTKIFELENQPAASTYSRSTVTEESITQDTLSELQSAGYEAYNVTASNYDTLETELKTDFASMGLDPDGSYIVVISGEDQPEDDGIAPASNDLLLPPHIEGSPAFFDYTYNGVTYYMRYVTVTAAKSDALKVPTTYAVNQQYWIENISRNLFNTALVAAVDCVNEVIPIGTLASIAFDSPEDYVYVQLSPGDVTILAETDWTCEYIQIWNATDQTWDASQWSEYTTSVAYCAGTVYDTASNKPIPLVYQPHYFTVYSNWYYSADKRKQDAVKAYNRYTIYSDCVNSVEFFFGNETGEIIYESSEEPLFVHRRSTAIVLPD